MPWLEPTRLTPDPTTVLPATRADDGGMACVLHPHAVAWRADACAAAVDRWGAALSLAHEAPALSLAPGAGNEVDLVADFGTELEGALHLELESAGPPVIAVSFGESVWEAREWGLPSLCAEQRPRKFHWTPSPGRSSQVAETGGFRFVRIRMVDASAPVTLRLYVRARFVTDRRSGDMQCADRRVQRLWQSSLYTAMLCTRPDTYWDGVKRDRHGWYGDARITQETMSWAYDLPQPALGMLHGLPVDRWANGIPNFSFDAVAMLRRQLLRFGAGDVRGLWPRFTEFLEWVLHSQTDADGLVVLRENVDLFFGIGFTDWSPMPLGGRLEECFCIQAAWVECLRNAAFCARALGADGRRWEAAAERIAAILRRRFRAPGRGFHHTLQLAEPPQTPWRMPLAPGLHRRLSYADRVRLGPSGPSRHSAARAWWAGLADGDAAGEVAAVLAGSELPGLITPYYGYYASMARAGLGDVSGAWDAMLGYLGPMLEDHDGATVWESYEPGVRGIASYALGGWPKSLCHGWGSGMVGFCARWLLGIEILAPGMRQLRLDPRLAVPFAATIPSPLGEIRIERSAPEAPVCYQIPAGIETGCAPGARVQVSSP